MESLIIGTLENYSIKANVVNRTDGPSTTLIEIKTSSKVKDVLALEEELSMVIHAPIRMMPIYANGSIGIEIPKQTKEPVAFEYAENDCTLPIYLGISTVGKKEFFDLSKAPHMLVAGATGQGKSVFLNCLLTALIIVSDAELLLIDPKKVEFTPYAKLNKKKFFKEFLPITDNSLASTALKELCKEMDVRYSTLKDSGCRNIAEYNSTNATKMSYIVCVIDEYADLIGFDKNIEQYVQRITQLARAVGIHMVIATQRPSAEIITGAIKANLPTRVAFKVGSNVDSRVVLDKTGAEKLTGSGDMLFSSGVELQRIQGCHVTCTQIREAIDLCNKRNFLKDLSAMLEGEENPSVSKLQRKLKAWGQDGFDKISEGLELIKVNNA